MKIEDFKKDFKDRNHVNLCDDLVLFKGFELWNSKTEESIFFRNFEELMEHCHNDKTVQKYIEELKDLKVSLEGGRGAGSGGGEPLFGGQSSGGGEYNPDLPARMNRMYNGNEMSAGHTVQTFRNQHVNDNKESVITFDDDGFVSDYGHGGSHSVGLPSNLDGKHVVHNHPSSSNFSNADLDAFSGTGMKSLTASGKGQDYTITKGKNFDAAGFKKAVSSAKTTEKDYNKAVDRFLKSNQKKYGYKYTVKKY